ncbi:MAG TPA: hypothetical protein VHE61_16070 [Opitutaceae bacterium]|nr:hypothetical protein [Opitutaceae bacterium]
MQIQLRGHQTSQEVIAALKDGEVDIGYDMLATWVEVGLNGAPITVVAETDWSNGGDKLLSRNGLTLAREKGHPVAVYFRGNGRRQRKTPRRRGRGAGG